jgi:hypothetical protein
MTDAKDAEPNVRANRYFIVESRMRCPQCDVVTAVFAFALPAGYESLIAYDDTPDDEEGSWEARGLAGVLSYVEYLPEGVAQRVGGMTSHYRLDLDGLSGERFWANRCQHCEARMEEEELHGEYDGTSEPMPSEGLEAIRVHEVREPFEAWAGGEANDMKRLDG